MVAIKLVRFSLVFIMGLAFNGRPAGDSLVRPSCPGIYDPSPASNSEVAFRCDYPSVIIEIDPPSDELGLACYKHYTASQWELAQHSCRGAADEGSTISRERLGFALYKLVLENKLPESSLADAYDNFRFAYLQGRIHSGHYLGLMYLYGHYVDANEEIALAYFETLAWSRRILESALMAGQIYFNRATPESYRKAREYYHQAAKGEDGLVEAAYLLGNFYIDVEQDITNGQLWLKKAAQRKYPAACARMISLLAYPYSLSVSDNDKAFYYKCSSQPKSQVLFFSYPFVFWAGATGLFISWIWLLMNNLRKNTAIE